MRLLLVTFDPPTGPGGIEGRAMAYTKSILRRSIHIEVAALAPVETESEEPYMGTKLVRLSSSIARLPRTIGALLGMINRSALDSVLLLSGGSTPLGVLLLQYCRLTGRRNAVLFYGRDILQARRRPIDGIALSVSLLLADGVATNSRYTSGLLPFRPGSRLSIIYPGVDRSIADGMASKGIVQSSLRILFVGRLVPRKGADLLIRAFARLRRSFQGIRLDIVGDGPEARNLRALTDQLNLGDSVTFYGTLRGQDLWQRYSEASLLVMPSRPSTTDTEGFGTVFLEAGVFGIPSVGTRTGGIPEAVQDGVTGRLVNYGDVDRLTDVIQNLLEDPTEMARLGKNARARALRFSWDVSTDKLLHLLGER